MLPLARFSAAAVALLLSLCLLVPPASAQTARISEETRTLATYPFSDPDPVAILARDARLYPYHSFEGYSVTSEPQEWKVVVLENDYIEVFVLPQVGGKVWGAVVKETGHEFIYRNEVMKFRNISLRGPWTSGGIEFNFGVIGHTPATATPVDYLLRENDDGSVSCIVGAMDLPSRTHWRVEIRLPADKAYFETNVLWYNPTPLEQPYYNWMTAAAFAQDDLEMAIPGDAYLEHSGEARSWPVDEQGRDLAPYRNNRFGSNKSFHVVGELNDFFGGYYVDEDYGFGHWARHEDMPGQKLWLWAQSRLGGIWEDLLTDTDGQYVEFQAGRLFVQYSPGDHVNPITQAGFEPMSASRWSETWFPLEGIGGLPDASRDGAMHVTRDATSLTVQLHAFVNVDDTLEIWSGDRLVSSSPLRLAPLQRFATTVELKEGAPYRVRVPALELDYDSDPEARRLARPFDTDPDARPALPAADRMAFEARELYKARRYDGATALFAAVLDDEPWHREALLGRAELAYRSGRYEEGLMYASKALQLDAYDAQANFIAGILYRARGDVADARDAFGWAARSAAYRSAAYAQLAEIMIGEGELAEAEGYARRALDYDRFSVPGWRALAVIGRLGGNDAVSRFAVDELLSIDPLHHFARAETHLDQRTGATGVALSASMGSEYAIQSLLELVVYYSELGLVADALTLLEAPALTTSLGASVDGAAGAAPLLRAWRAYLRDDVTLLDGPDDPTFTFPFRRESLPVLEWAHNRSSDWMWTYLYGLNHWAVNNLGPAVDALKSLGDRPEFAPFYVVRAEFEKPRDAPDGGRVREADLRRAVALDPETRVLHIYLARFFLAGREWQDALEVVGTARRRFPGDFNLALLHVQALLGLDRAAEALNILDDIEVLPSENARTSHQLWQQAHVMAALDAFESGDDESARAHLSAALEWPEQLGQGRPYQPEERLVRYVLARVEEGRGDTEAAREHYEAVVAATGVVTRPRPVDLLLIGALATLRPAELQPLIDANLLGGAVASREVFDDTVGWWAQFATVFRDEGPVAGREALRAMASGSMPFGEVEGRLVLRALTAEGALR